MHLIIVVLILAAIFALASRISSEKNPPPFSKAIPCPVCGGTGKTWNQAHGSSDLELVDCERCDGSGEIYLDDS